MDKIPTKGEYLEVLLRTKIPGVIEKFLTDWITKSYEKGKTDGEWEAYEEIKDDAVAAAHRTKQGWCCACGADIAFLNGRIKDAIQQERSRLLEEIKKLDVSGGGSGRRLKEQIKQLIIKF